MARINKYTAKELEFAFNEYLEHNKSLTFYKPEMLKGGERAGDIINVPIYSPLSIMAFCLFADISMQTFNTNCNAEVQNDIELLEKAIHIRTHIQDEQIRGGLAGHYNANLVGRLNGIKEQQEVDIKGALEVINITIQDKEIDLT